MNLFPFDVFDIHKVNWNREMQVEFPKSCRCLQLYFWMRCLCVPPLYSQIPGLYYGIYAGATASCVPGNLLTEGGL